MLELARTKCYEDKQIAFYALQERAKKKGSIDCETEGKTRNKNAGRDYKRKGGKEKEEEKEKIRVGSEGDLLDVYYAERYFDEEYSSFNLPSILSLFFVIVFFSLIFLFNFK